ncbi:MAG: bifunctional oligoribonuclease/PAP phosphatase NrnA [Butyrivibrio sp.]
MNSIYEELKGAATVAITGHIRPDGDCTGATLGLYNYLRENMPELKVDIFLETIEPRFAFLSGSDEIKNCPGENSRYDVFIILDCGDLGRVASFTVELIKNSAKTICIDHHLTTDYFATVNHVLPQVSSASEVLYELLDENKISKAVAECLYVGIIHDTGVFKYQSVTSRTMEIAGKLMDKGINFTAIIDETFFRKSYVQNKLLGISLMNSQVLLEGRFIYSYMPMATLNEYGVPGRDLSGVIDQLRFTEGVQAAMFIYDLPDGSVKVSLRSVDYVDVNKIANAFGGGGHMRAAGFTVKMPVEEIVKKVTGLLNEQL